MLLPFSGWEKAVCSSAALLTIHQTTWCYLFARTEKHKIPDLSCHIHSPPFIAVKSKHEKKLSDKLMTKTMLHMLPLSSSSFVVYVTMLFRNTASYCRMIRKSWLGDLERILKREIVAWLECLPAIYQEGLRRSMSSLSYSSVLAVIQTMHLPNTCYKCFHLSHVVQFSI
jgi:hypothetical protein